MTDGISASERIGWPAHVERHGWTGADVSKEQLTYTLTPEQLRAIKSRVNAIKATGKPLTAITRADFADPILTPLLDGIERDLKWGPGLVFIGTVPVEEYDTDDLRRIFWGIATHFGSLVSQSKFGDRIGEVMDLSGRRANTSVRGYVSNEPLGLHTDHAEMFGLFCVNKASTGGAEHVRQRAESIRGHQGGASRIPPDPGARISNLAE